MGRREAVEGGRVGEAGRVTRWTVAVATVASLLLGSASPRAEPMVVGQARQVVRSVFGTVGDQRLPLVVDGDVFWQELIETGDESASRIVFRDETTLSTGPNSRVRIDEFVYAGDPGVAGRVVIELSRGVLRFVSGLQPSSVYSVRTPNAMIGVRGTDFVVLVDAEYGTRVFVRRGEVTLAGIAGGRVDVRAGLGGRVGPAGSPDPGDVQPPAPGEVASATEVTALLAIAGEAGASGASSEPADVSAVSGGKGQAAAVRAATPATATGPGCGGC